MYQTAAPKGKAKSATIWYTSGKETPCQQQELELNAIFFDLDGMGTACNLTGDGAIALIVDRFREGCGAVQCETERKNAT